MGVPGIVHAIRMPFNPSDYSPDTPPLVGTIFVSSLASHSLFRQRPHLLLPGCHHPRPLLLTCRLPTPAPVSPPSYYPPVRRRGQFYLFIYVVIFMTPLSIFALSTRTNHIVTRHHGSSWRRSCHWTQFSPSWRQIPPPPLTFKSAFVESGVVVANCYVAFGLR